jgi:hypothetical protein
MEQQVFPAICRLPVYLGTLICVTLYFLLNTHNLKRTLFLLSAILLSATYSFAQQTETDTLSYPEPIDTTSPKPELGIKLGVQGQSIMGNAWDNSYKVGAVGGFFIGYHKKKVGVRAEVLGSTSRYSANKGKDAAGNPTGLADTAGNLADFKIITLNVPVLFEYYVTPKLTIQVGPQLNSILFVKSLDAFPGAAKTLFKQTEFAGVIGVEGKLPHNILAGARYNYGFSDINNVTISGYPGAWTTQSVQVYVGYRFQ